MSTALAIAATTRVMASVIDRNIGASGLDAILGTPPYTTVRPPDRIETGDSEVTRPSLFLYHVSYNQGWKSVALPSRNGAGDLVDRPPLALDLHYVLTAFGAGEYEPQMLLGLGMQALHEMPFLDRSRIRALFTPPPALSNVDAALATTGLADQIELIKITPEPLGTEELSKLWTAFGGKFRPTAGYEATVVLIESTAPVRAGLPVLKRNLEVIQFQLPYIAGVEPQNLAWSPAAHVTLRGENLIGEGVVVLFDAAPNLPQVPEALAPGGALVQAALPLLPAGINTVRVVQRVAVGAPPERNVVQSNVALFALQPVIRTNVAPPPIDNITVGPTNTTVTPNTTPVTVELDPALAGTQRVQLLLNEMVPPVGQAARAYTFDAKPDQIASHAVTFTTFGTRSGQHLVRVRVDGADSPLRTDGTGAFTGPVVTL